MSKINLNNATRVVLVKPDAKAHKVHAPAIDRKKQSEMESMYIQMHISQLNTMPVANTHDVIESINQAVKMGYRINVTSFNDKPNEWSDQAIRFPLRYQSKSNGHILTINTEFSIAKKAMGVLNKLVSDGIIVMKRKRK